MVFCRVVHAQAELTLMLLPPSASLPTGFPSPFLSDVISLVVALYAIRLATASSTAKYSYGWQRAEILGESPLSASTLT